MNIFYWSTSAYHSEEDRKRIIRLCNHSNVKAVLVDYDKNIDFEEESLEL